MSISWFDGAWTVDRMLDRASSFNCFLVELSVLLDRTDSMIVSILTHFSLLRSQLHADTTDCHTTLYHYVMMKDHINKIIIIIIHVGRYFINNLAINIIHSN